MAGVVVAVATVPETPLAVVTETDVTVPVADEHACCPTLPLVMLRQLVFVPPWTGVFPIEMPPDGGSCAAAGNARTRARIESASVRNFFM